MDLEHIVNTKQKICNYCIMDDSAQEIQFFSNGCNFCISAKERIKLEIIEDSLRTKEIEKLVSKIKSNNQKYDCIIGVSGGVDSSYVAYIVKKKLKLNPLAVHLDNGWNSKKSTKNIYELLKKLKIDLVTHVVDWKEFREIQRSLLLSNIKNFEIATDHAIMSLMLQKAKKYKIKYILHGGNIATESIMPGSWMEPNYDFSLIKKIVSKYSNVKIKTLPHSNIISIFTSLFIRKIRLIPILNYFPYNREDALNLLESELSYEPYGEKHFESVVTKFFQSYLLPKKFNIDKRRAHLSSLIVSKQISRKKALEIVSESHYSSTNEELDEKNYFLKKMKISNEEFETIMNDSSGLIIKSNLSFLHKPLIKYRSLIRKMIRKK